MYTRHTHEMVIFLKLFQDLLKPILQPIMDYKICRLLVANLRDEFNRIFLQMKEIKMLLLILNGLLKVTKSFITINNPKKKV